MAVDNDQLFPGVEVDRQGNRFKLTLSIRTNPLLSGLFSAALIIWMIMLAVVLYFLIGGYSTSLVLTVLLAVWILVWLYFGRFLWRRWQDSLATREIIYLNEVELIIRRPLSLFGSTRVFDLAHVSPFYFSERHNSPAFDYAYLHVYFGTTLPAASAHHVIDLLNRLLFPDRADVASQDGAITSHQM